MDASDNFLKDLSADSESPIEEHITGEYIYLRVYIEYSKSGLCSEYILSNPDMSFLPNQPKS